MFTKILVPLDRSPLAEQAIGRAAAIARASKAGLDLVIAHEPGLFSGAPSASPDDASLAADQQYVESVAAELSDAQLSVTCAAVRGRAAAAIRERATEVGADLIVMTSHGRTGLSRAWLGSVTDSVVRGAAVPVLVLHSFEDAGGRRESVKPFTHVLVPLDGSAFADDVLPMAAALVQPAVGMISLLRVVNFVPMLLPGDITAPAAPPPAIEDVEATKALVAQTHGELAEVARRLRAEFGVSVDARVEASQQVAWSIVTFAKRNDVDVIAMSTHGRGMARLLLGSIADKVLRSAGLPVLLRRPVDVRGRSVLADDGAVAESGTDAVVSSALRDH